MTDHAYLPARKLLCRSDEYALAVNHDKVTNTHLFFRVGELLDVERLSVLGTLLP